MAGEFYVIATPIGNLEDITLRAVRILSEVDFVFCEDTREGSKLLGHFSIKKPLDSFHAQSGRGKTDKILELLAQNKNIALISDAGTPGISDPGAALISEIIDKMPEVKITPIPGVSALTAALSASGLPTNEFTFIGFLPHKKGRNKIFGFIAESPRTVAFYESPHRIMKTLESLKELLPEGRKICVAREMTKIYEEFVRGNAKEVMDHFSSNPEKIRGEFTILVAGA